MSSNNIKVAIKARPILKKERDNKLVSQWKVVNNSIKQIDSQADPFCFDHVFDQDASNQDIFDTVVKPIVDAAVKGFNGTIFAYGQTSSGKTYTMLGDENNPGVMVLTAKEIFKEIELAVDRQFLLRVGYIEIYNEKVFDLLNKGNVDLKVHETANGDITVNCEEFIVTSEESLMNYLLVGSKHRRIGETNMNERSSRSHSIFRIIIESSSINKPPDEGSVQISNLNLVDLAGSERADQTGTTGTRLKEGAHINKSLLYLSRVINSLSENEALKYINYRDSKLTRILQASLGGNALTAIVCNINPTAVEETNSTLNFAMRAKSIKNKPQVNEVISDTASIKRLQKEIARLESQLKSTNNKIKVIELERQICEERLKIVHCHSRNNDNTLRRRTWSACVNPKAVEQLPDLRHSSITTDQLPDLKPSPELALKMTPLITLRGETLSPLKEFKCTDDRFNETAFHNPYEVLKTPEVFKKRHHIPVESPADNMRCRQVEKELEELMDFTNLEKKFNVEHDVVSSLSRKLKEAQDKIAKYEEEKFEILSSKMDEWNEKEMALRQQYLNLQNEMAEKDKIMEDLRNREADYKTRLDQSNERIKTLQLELSDKSGKECELELHQQRAKNRECELLEALEEKDKEINNLNEKFRFVSDKQSLQNVRKSTSTKISQADLERVCEKCKEYEISLNRINTEYVRLREEQCCIQKENDELSSQLMEAIQECEGFRSLNEKLQAELATLEEQKIAFTSTEEDKLKSRKENILRFYHELLVYFPELLDGLPDVNDSSLIWDLWDFWEEISKKCTKKMRQLKEDVKTYELKETERQKKISTLHDGLDISKKENNDLLEKISKLEDQNSNLDNLVQTKQQEIMKLTDEMQSKFDLLLKDNFELKENVKDLEHKLKLKNDLIAELETEISAMKQESLKKLNNLEPLKTKNDTELSESLCTISQQLNEIQSLTTQIKILEEQVSKEKALRIKADPDGVSAVLANENIFMEEGIGKVLKMDEFLINLDALEFVIDDNTANLYKEGPLEEQYAKLAVRDVKYHGGNILYICGINQEVSNNKGDKHVVLVKGKDQHNVKFEIKYILKPEVSDIKNEEPSSSDATNMENVSLKDCTLIKNMHNKNEIIRDYSKMLEVILTKLESNVLTTCSVLNEKTQWLDEKLSHLENIQKTAQNNTCKEKSQVNHDVLLKEQRNLIQQTKNVESRILEKMLHLNSVIETFSVKLNMVEKLRDALEKCFFKLRQQSERLTKEKNTFENVNINLNSEIFTLQKLISDTKVQLHCLEIENNELKNNLIQKEVYISDLRKENHELSNKVLNLESIGFVEKSSGKENLEKVLVLEDSNQDLLNQSQLHSNLSEDSKDQLRRFESENCELRTLDRKDEHISDISKEINKLQKLIVGLERPISLEKMPGEENYKNPIEEDLNQSQQSKIIMCTNELKEHVKKMNDLLTSISLCIKSQFELHEHNNSKVDDDVSNDVQGMAEDNVSLVILNEKLEYLLKDIQLLDTVKRKEIEQLKEASNLLNSEKISLKKEITESQKRNEELEQKLLDLSNTKELMENKIHELTLVQKNLENIKNDELKSKRKEHENRNEELQRMLLDLNNTKTLLENKVKQYEKTLAEMSSEQNAINDKLKSSLEINESLTEEVKSLKDLKNELERQCDIYCEENSKLEMELGKSNDLIKHTEEDCLTLKLSISSLRDKVLQLEKERNSLLIERIEHETNIKELTKEILNLKQENSSLMSDLDNLKKEYFTIMKTKEENTKLCHSIEELKLENKALNSENIVVTSKFDHLNKEHLSLLEKHKEKTNLCRCLEEDIIALQKELDKCKSKKNYLEMQTKNLELKIKQSSANSERLDGRVKDLCEENQKIRKDWSEECDRLRELITIANDNNVQTCKKLQETKAALELCKKQFSEERAMQVKLRNQVEELSKKLENITNEYNACLLHVKQYSTSNAADINDSENNCLLKQLKEMEKMYIFKSKQLQNQVKELETSHSKLLISIPTSQSNTVRHCCSGSGNKESNKPAAFASDLRHLSHSTDQRHQKMIDNLLGENKQLRIKNEKLEAELNSSRTLSQKDRKSRRQSTHDEKRQSLWDSTSEVGTMTQPTDQLCNCVEFDIKVKELKTQLRIKESQINTLLLEMKTNPLKEENQSLKKLLSEEESEKKRLRIDISKLKQEISDQANRQKECDQCASKANKLKLNKNIQTENIQLDREEELVKLQKKYEDLKLVCRMRKDAIRDLEKRINTEKENEANNKQNPTFSHSQNPQEILDTLKEENRLLKKKYEQTKVICIARGEEIECLAAKLKKNGL